MSDRWKGPQLAAIQKRLNLTDDEFAAKLGCRPHTFYRWRTTPGYLSNYAIARIDSFVDSEWESATDWLKQFERYRSERLLPTPGAALSASEVAWDFRQWCKDASIFGEPGFFTAGLIAIRAGLVLVDDENRVITGSAIRGHLLFGSQILGVAKRSRDGGDVHPPIEPEAGPGPQYGAVNGMLAGIPSIPEDYDVPLQSKLKLGLSQKLKSLGSGLIAAGNQHPEIAKAVAEYTELLSKPIEQIDVVGVWSVGNSLTELLSAYHRQDQSKTISAPLEPQLIAALRSIGRDHAAFILGFPEGVSLVERADRFGLPRGMIEELASPGQLLLDDLVSYPGLVEKVAQDILSIAADAVRQVGWSANRASFAAYLHVRNAIRALIKYSIGKDPNVGSALGLLTAASTIAGDPDGGFIRLAVPYLSAHAKELIAFFSHSPEFRMYVEWALAELEREAKTN